MVAGRWVIGSGVSEPSVFRNIFSANTLFRSASWVGFASLTRQTRANVPLRGYHRVSRPSFQYGGRLHGRREKNLPVPSVRTLAKSSRFNFREVLEASWLGAPGATTPPGPPAMAACALSRLRLAPACPAVAGTWWATVAAIWGNRVERGESGWSVCESLECARDTFDKVAQLLVEIVGRGGCSVGFRARCDEGLMGLEQSGSSVPRTSIAKRDTEND